MAASLIEQILSRAAAVLSGATSAGSRVYRARQDAFDQDELPAINLSRRTSDTDSIGQGASRSLLIFEIDLHVQGINWETAADALHMEVDALLAADTTLASLGHGLRCGGTEMLGAVADFISGKLTARYQIQVLTRAGNFTRAVN